MTQSSKISSADCDNSIYHEGNPPEIPTIDELGALPTAGGTMTGNILFDKAAGENGHGEVYKYHSDWLDYGMRIKDVTADGAQAILITRASKQKVQLELTPAGGSATVYEMFGEHNTDLLAEQIQTLLDGGTISMSAVKSVQRGVITIDSGSAEGTATISSVDTTKSVVLFGGSTHGTSANYYNDTTPGYWDARLVLTSATKVTASRYSSWTSGNVYVPYQVIEFA